MFELFMFLKLFQFVHECPIQKFHATSTSDAYEHACITCENSVPNGW